MSNRSPIANLVVTRFNTKCIEIWFGLLPEMVVNIMNEIRKLDSVEQLRCISNKNVTVMPNQAYAINDVIDDIKDVAEKNGLTFASISKTEANNPTKLKDFVKDDWRNPITTYDTEERE